jgi:prepilin-type N-terminal cleavage/methylation domain-containing protein
MKTTTRGFSLIELLVALSILAVVAAIIVPRFLNVRSQAAATTTAAQQQELQSDIQKWISLGGTVAAGATDGDFLNLLNQTGAGRTNAHLTDSTGNFGSSTISLGLPAIDAGAAAPTPSAAAQGWHYGAGNEAYYTDGAGNGYVVKVFSGTGDVQFQPVSGSLSTATNIGPNS